MPRVRCRSRIRRRAAQSELPRLWWQRDRRRARSRCGGRRAMKAISLSQPWAWLILNEEKRVENRKRNLGNYRGPVLLHAAKRCRTEHEWMHAYDFVLERFGLAMAR